MEAGFGVGALLASLIAAVIDVRTARLPNWLTIGGLVAALLFRACVMGWAGLAAGLLGALAACGVLLLPFLARGIGGGDVKLMAAVGGWLGIHHALAFILATAIAGGFLAIGYMVIQKRTSETLLRVAHLIRFHLVSGMVLEPEPCAPSESLRFPYSLAIASGALFVVVSTSASLWG